jgi:hypothetical protein
MLQTFKTSWKNKARQGMVCLEEYLDYPTRLFAADQFTAGSLRRLSIPVYGTHWFQDIETWRCIHAEISHLL